MPQGLQKLKATLQSLAALGNERLATGEITWKVENSTPNNKAMCSKGEPMP